MYEEEALAPLTYPKVSHYHGDTVRLLFVFGAIILIVAQSTGVTLPLSVAGTVIAATVLIIAAGITSPEQMWIHWVNAVIAAYGTFLFSLDVITKYHAGSVPYTASFVFLEALALISLIALYFTTRTIRDLLIHHPKSNERKVDA